MVRRRHPSDPRAVAAFRATIETEAFLHEALRHPERYSRIPIIRVGYGSFAPGLAAEYWEETLGLRT